MNFVRELRGDAYNLRLGHNLKVMPLACMRS